MIWKKCRKNEIDEEQAQLLIQKFEKDSIKFIFITEDFSLRKTAQELIGTHWKIGLRTLDAIQLASALSVKNKLAYS